jgi:hypothetical protein
VLQFLGGSYEQAPWLSKFIVGFDQLTQLKGNCLRGVEKKKVSVPGQEGKPWALTFWRLHRYDMPLK